MRIFPAKRRRYVRRTGVSSAGCRSRSGGAEDRGATPSPPAAFSSGGSACSVEPLLSHAARTATAAKQGRGPCVYMRSIRVSAWCSREGARHVATPRWTSARPHARNAPSGHTWEFLDARRAPATCCVRCLNPKCACAMAGFFFLLFLCRSAGMGNFIKEFGLDLKKNGGLIENCGRKRALYSLRGAWALKTSIFCVLETPKRGVFNGNLDCKPGPADFFFGGRREQKEVPFPPWHARTHMPFAFLYRWGWGWVCLLAFHAGIQPPPPGRRATVRTTGLAVSRALTSSRINIRTRLQKFPRMCLKSAGSLRLPRGDVHDAGVQRTEPPSGPCGYTHPLPRAP